MALLDVGLESWQGKVGGQRMPTFVFTHTAPPGTIWINPGVLVKAGQFRMTKNTANGVQSYMCPVKTDSSQ